jgi:uncharacterized membrane protein
VSESRSALQRIDRAAAAATHFAVLSVWPVVFAAAIGATLYGSTHPQLLPEMFDNRLGSHERLVALGCFGGALLVVFAFYLVALRSRRVVDPSLSRAERVQKLHRLLAFVMSGPFLVALTEAKIEVNHPWRTWLYIGLAVVPWWPTIKAIHERRQREGAVRWSGLTDRQRDWASLVLVLILWATYAWFFSRLSITNHHALTTRIIDLGLYDNIFYQSSHGRPLGCSFLRGGSHLSAHFDPILVLLSPFYLLWPRAELLLVLQSVWCGAGVVPVYLLGRERLGSRLYGLVWAIAFALQPALHGANLYEFHSLTLLMTPLLFALYFLLSGKLRAYYFALPVSLLVREDAALLMSFVGFYGLIANKPGYARAGWTTILVSIVYFVIAKSVFMTSIGLFNQGPESYGFSYYYEDMIPNKLGELDFLVTLFTNPAFVVALATKPAKLSYLMVLFFPVLFLPLWAGRARLMLLYGLIFVLLASRTAVFSPHFQYSAILLPVVIALGPVGLRRLRESRPNGAALTAAAMACVLVASSLTSWKHGAFVDNAAFRGGFKRIVRTLNESQSQQYAQVRELLSHIEPDASVSATDLTGAHISNRMEAYSVGQDRDSDYFLIDSRDLRGGTKEVFKRRQAGGTLELVGRAHTWQLYRTVPGTQAP